MAVSPAEPESRGSLDFAESSVLEAVIPINSNFDFKRELSSWDGVVEDENGSILPFLAQRQVLLLDELLPVYVVFRAPLLDDTILKSYLARLILNMEAFAFSTAPPPEGEPKTSPKEIIYSGVVENSTEAIIASHGQGDNAYTYVAWKVDIAIARPQGRFHKPAIYFQPTASFKPAERPKKSSEDDEYLPSRVPTALNLLQAFDNDPALAGIHPRLSAMRISKMAPNAPVVREMIRPIRNGQRPLFRILPPLVWRIRYSRVHASLNDLSLLASLELEVTQYVAYNVKLKRVDLQLKNGAVQDLTGELNMDTTHAPGDQLTYLFKIQPDLASDGTPIAGHKGHLILKMEADVFVSEICIPPVTIEWGTDVDFTNEQTSSLIRASQRLSNPGLPNSKSPNPDALPAHDTQEQNLPSNEINVTLTISGPPKVQTGTVFTWDVFIVNRSDRTRKLAVLVIPKRKRDYEKHTSRPSTSSAGDQRIEHKNLLTSAVVDENVVYARQKSGRTESAELICLTTDIRLGSLSAGSCYTADLKFIALSAGVLSVESVRVIDLSTNETADIRDLPRIIAVDGED